MPPPDALYLADGDRFVPTDLTRGPWTPDAQHGGPPAGLVARAVERHEGGEGMQVARLTIELLRPVPVVPLLVTTRTLRPGRKVQLVEAILATEGTEVCRAVALRIRTKPLALPSRIHLPAPPPLPAEPSPQEIDVADWPAFHNLGVEMRYVSGTFREMGPATVWIRLRHPLVAGEEPSPLVRVATAADFGNGVSAVLDFDRYLFINPDLSIHLHRHPAGEWVCLDATTRPEPHGVGLAECALWDERGPIGRSLQSLLVDDER